MKQLIVLPVLLLGISFSSHAQTVLPGSQIEVRTNTPVTVSPWDRGRTYPGYVARDVFDRYGNVAIPAGSQAQFIVRQTGYDQFALDVDSVVVNGNRYVLSDVGPSFDVGQAEYDSSAALASVMNSISAAPGSTVSVEVNGDELHVPSGAIVRTQIELPIYVGRWTGRQDSSNYR